MKKKVFLIVFVFMLLFSYHSASAEVITVKKPDETIMNYIYVAGNTSFYPIEYYNPKTQQYEGVMPEFLKTISQKTGLNFVYIHSGNYAISETVEKFQIDMVSAYISGENASYIKESIPVFSYMQNGKDVNVGLSFTNYANDNIIDIIKKVTENISQTEVNGYFVSNEFEKPKDDTWFIIITILCAVLACAIIYLVITRNLNVKKSTEQIKKTDVETGMGNLVFFEEYFKSMLSNYLETSYCIAYIIIDSSYLQTYHGQNEFSDIVRYTAGVLQEEMRGNEQVARISENGFVFVFKPEDVLDAKRRVKRIITRLNLFMGMMERNFKPIFYSAVYSLSEEDVSCELLLFNLRRNCNEILGSKEQIKFCDMHMMNSEAEKKKMLESFARGFENEEFKLYLQFVVNNKTKDIISCEALSRWETPENGVVPPGGYIGAMEK